MSEVKHTPGPWVAIERTGGASTVPVPIAYVTGPKRVVDGDGRSVGYAPEDARLIAAAPDLVKACKLLVGEDGEGMIFSDRIAFAVAAIARAEGRP